MPLRFLAHVRAASPGLPVTETNCHPFSDGRFAFMHNGAIGGFPQVRRALLGSLSDAAFAAIHGSTDSELMFGVFLDQHRGVAGAEPGEGMATALKATVRQVTQATAKAGVTEQSYLNLAVSERPAGRVLPLHHGPTGGGGHPLRSRGKSVSIRACPIS